MATKTQLIERLAKGRATAVANRGKSATKRISEARIPLESPEQASAIAERLTEMPNGLRGGYLKAMRGKSPTAAIQAHCLECMGWNRAETPRCTASACALYPYRPGRAGIE